MPYKILVIEDEAPVRDNLAELLKAEDYDVVTAEDGFIGFYKALQYFPDLIICDIMMPGLEGHDVLRALREDPRTNSTPFVFLTAKASISDIRMGRAMGAHEYLTKPFAKGDLLEAVRTGLMLQSTEFLGDDNQDQLEALKEKIQNQEDILRELEQCFENSPSDLRNAVKSLNTMAPGIYKMNCLKLLLNDFNDQAIAS